MEVIVVDAEIMHGTPCFGGTRVPVSSLFSYLARGRDIEYFLECFPTVGREQVLTVLEKSKVGVLEAV